MEALPQLESRHFEWLFCAAQSHFVERIDELEIDNLRHRAHAGEPHYKASIAAPTNRQEKVESNDHYLAQYRRIVEFCIAVRKRIMEHSSEEFAKRVVAEITRNRRGS